MYTVQTGKKDAPQLGLEGLEQDDQVPLETLGKSIFLLHITLLSGSGQFRTFAGFRMDLKNESRCRFFQTFPLIVMYRCETCSYLRHENNQVHE